MHYNTFIEKTRDMNQAVMCSNCGESFFVESPVKAITVIKRIEIDSNKVSIITYNYITEEIFYHERNEKIKMDLETFTKSLKNTIERNNNAYTKLEIIDKTIDGQIILPQKIKKIENDWYCENCIDELFTLCENCENYIDNDNIKEINNKFYCEDCEGELFYICYKCDEHILTDDAISIDDYIYCSASCANDNGYYECDDCDNWVNTNREIYYNTNDNYICSRCSENYFTCENCNEIIHIDDCNSNDNGYYCNDCYEENNLIHEHDFIPDLIFYKMSWENTLFLGIELETETKNNTKEMAEKINNWTEKNKCEDIFYFKKDGTLENGIEIVFHPFTLQALHKKFKLRKFLQYLSEIGLTSYDSGNCGLHVHVSLNHFKEENKNFWDEFGNLHKIKLFFYKCESELKQFSKRKNYAYCKFDDEKPINGHNSYDRYSAINTDTHKNTIEFRLFRGTLKHNRLLASLQFSEALSFYIVNTSYNIIDKLNSDDLWQDFIAYCKKENRYNHFVNYIKG